MKKLKNQSYKIYKSQNRETSYCVLIGKDGTAYAQTNNEFKHIDDSLLQNLSKDYDLQLVGYCRYVLDYGFSLIGGLE